MRHHRPACSRPCTARPVAGPDGGVGQIEGILACPGTWGCSTRWRRFDEQGQRPYSGSRRTGTAVVGRILSQGLAELPTGTPSQPRDTPFRCRRVILGASGNVRPHRESARRASGLVRPKRTCSRSPSGPGGCGSSASTSRRSGRRGAAACR